MCVGVSGVGRQRELRARRVNGAELRARLAQRDGDVLGGVVVVNVAVPLAVDDDLDPRRARERDEHVVERGDAGGDPRGRLHRRAQRRRRPISIHKTTTMRARTTTMARLCLLATLSLSHALQAQTRHRTSLLQARTTALRAQADGPVVALTREQGKNGGLAAALEGVASVEIPAVAQTRTADMEAALDAALLFVDEAWDWVVITSPEAARTFGDAAARSGVSMMRDARSSRTSLTRRSTRMMRMTSAAAAEPLPI